MPVRSLLAVALAIAACLAPTRARAFCRTQTCPLPPSFSPQADACTPPDFASYCASLNPPAKAIPVWWRNACVSYDLQENASKQVSYAQADALFATAFAKWTSIDCPGAPASSGSSRVSIDVRDLGPVQCNQVQYNQDQGNQHVILFRDDTWPHDDQSNTLGLTTITFDPDTGEIYDADMEINATVPLSADPNAATPMGGYDLLSIVTHESGHFLGMAHSGDPYATMYAAYTQGSTSMRSLTADDVAGLCSIYAPDGTRAVDMSVAPGGRVQADACDPTPRHGFSTTCAKPGSKGCDVPADAAPDPWGFAGIAVVAAVGAATRRGSRRAACAS